jgi:predicted KAP-like P-loop ATPase
MWSDNETDLDLLNVAYLVSAITETVLRINLLPITVGVFGDWGSGKSSIVRMAQKELGEHDDAFCLSFNGWLFEGYEDAKVALMGTILDEIRDKRKLGPKAKELITKLAKRVDLFGLVGMVSKSAATFALPESNLVAAAQLVGDVAGQVADVIKEPDDEESQEQETLRKNVREFRSDFGKLLKETKIRTLVVFIDDLDRCLPDTIIETLEAVRLFLFVPGTAFVISADERLVQQAVERRFPEPLGAKNEIAQNYLEKLVQVPIRIPSLGPNEVRSYMNLLFGQLRLGERFPDLCQKIHTEAGGESWDSVLDYAWFQRNVQELPPEFVEDLDLTERIGVVLAEMLSGNPRQVKRFLNTLILRMQMSEKRGVKLKQGILAKLMLLEYKQQESFRVLADLQAQQSGKPAELEVLEQEARKNKENKPVEADDDGNDSEKENTDKKQAEGKNQGKQIALDKRLEAWLSDPWMLNWLSSEPLLAGEDLRPYFYVSRDRIGPIIGPKLQLSPEAQKALEKLISPSDAERSNALQMAANLSNSDASSILQALINRARRAERSTGEDAPINILVSYSEARPELIHEAILALGRIPETSLGTGLPPRIARLKQKSTASSNIIDELLRKWSESNANPGLATAANSILKRSQR